MTGSIVFPDDTGPAPSKIQMGAGTDMKIYSDGTFGVITALNGLYVKTMMHQKLLPMEQFQMQVAS